MVPLRKGLRISALCPLCEGSAQLRHTCRHGPEVNRVKNEGMGLVSKFTTDLVTSSATLGYYYLKHAPSSSSPDLGSSSDVLP